jgi:hypothetical protein
VLGRSTYWVIGVALTTAAVWAQSNSVNESISIASPNVGLTGQDRLRWVALTTFGPKNLAAGVVVAGIQTWRNEPEAWGPHWDGFGTRYGARLAAGGTANVLEAGIGSLWGEDPRYFRAAGQPMKTRIGHVVKMAFVDHNRSGGIQPAYARYFAVPSGILLSNTWRPDQSTAGHVTHQVALSFLSRIIGNAFSEFLPDLIDRSKRHPNPAPGNNP